MLGVHDRWLPLYAHTPPSTLYCPETHSPYLLTFSSSHLLTFSPAHALLPACVCAGGRVGGKRGCGETRFGCISGC